jgi:hypothetical protein
MNAPGNLKKYDRTAEDVGNIVHLEHFNVVHNDQRLATLFYVVGLGGTRDPYLFVGLDNMWVNFGRTQAHLPSRGAAPKPEVLRGRIGLVVPSLAELKTRLERVAPALQQSRFSFSFSDSCVETTCPWGNRIRCHAPTPEFGPIDLGIAYIEFDVPPGSAEGIARFYTEVMGSPARADAGRATVSVGRHQKLIFSETAEELPAYDGHHIQIYLSDFSGPYQRLKQRDLITMETDAHEWRLQWLVDPRDNLKLFQIEHEVRSMKHPLFGRPLVNRNTGITNMTYVAGHDAFLGTY